MVSLPTYRKTCASSTGSKMLPVVSLFTGAGGLDLGLKRAGKGQLDFRAWVEIDSDCRQTLIANRLATEQGGRLFDDIETTRPRNLMAAARLRRDETFLLVGGPPCQAFSTAGLRNSVQVPAGRVVHAYFEMVRELRPRFFLFENVRGL